MGLLGDSRELQFGTSKLWQNHMQIQRTKYRGLLVLGFRRNLGRVVLSKSPLEKNKSSHWLQPAVSALLLGQGGILLLFKKADELPMWFLFSLLPAGYAGCKEWPLPEILCLQGFLTPFQTRSLLFTFTIIMEGVKYLKFTLYFFVRHFMLLITESLHICSHSWELVFLYWPKQRPRKVTWPKSYS